MDRRTPRPVRPPEDLEDSTLAPSAPQLPNDYLYANASPGYVAQAPTSGALPDCTVATCQAQVAYLRDRSIIAADRGVHEQKRKLDYALAHAYVQLGEALLLEYDRVADDERRAEQAMSCLSDAATLFHALGATDERDRALQRARHAHELYSW